MSKNSKRIEAYGTVDELNSLIGVCRSMNTVQEVDKLFEEIQNDLFALGADLATPRDSSPASVHRIDASDIARLEHHIDAIEKQVQPITSFILPGGNRTAALIHFARTVCRRAERLVVPLQEEESLGEHVIIYLNRLSDLLFMMARWINALSNTPESKWNP